MFGWLEIGDYYKVSVSQDCSTNKLIIYYILCILLVKLGLLLAGNF